MSKSSIVCGLDIGSGSIKILVAQTKGLGETEALYIGQRPSSGIRRGVIVDVEEVSNTIGAVVRDAQLASKQKISGLCANIGGSHIFCTMSHGLVSVSRADGSISEEDMGRVLQAAKTISLSSNKEIVAIYPREYVVDGEGGVKDALGMKGVRLEAEALILAGFAPYLKNLEQSILKADLEILDRIPSAIAGAAAALSPSKKELGAALVDIGAGTTSVAVYQEGDLLHLAVLPIGSANITNDIAIGLRVDIETAERIKIERGTCVFKGADKKIKIENANRKNPPDIFSQRAVSKIIQDRVTEIFELVNKELKKTGWEAKLPAGIVLAGGGAKLDGIVELAQKEFRLSCCLGVPQGVSNLDQDPALINVCGLALSQIEESQTGNLTRVNYASKNWWDKIKRALKVFAP
jgi:cell division protein FtsA